MGNEVGAGVMRDVCVTGLGDVWVIAGLLTMSDATTVVTTEVTTGVSEMHEKKYRT